MSKDDILKWEDTSPSWNQGALQVSHGGYGGALWIDVKCKLPENHQLVLVINEQGEMAVCECKIYESDWKYIFMLYETSHQITNVTHWMQLPEPPKEELKNER